MSQEEQSALETDDTAVAEPTAPTPAPPPPPASAGGRRERDVLAERFQIHSDKPLGSGSALLANMFEVSDRQSQHQNLYAAVLDNTLPYRMNAIQAYQRVRLPVLQPLLAHGPVFVSALGEVRYVLIFQKIFGRPLADHFAQLRTYSDRAFMNDLIQPMVQLLELLASMEVTIGQINTHTLYLQDGKLIVGEFLSRPCGYDQSYFFEPIDRLMANPLGKGEGSSLVDFFALGVTIAHCALGFNPNQDMSQADCLGHRLTMGTYNTIFGNRELSPAMEDLLRGLLNDNVSERWGFSQIGQWMGGKRFNIIRPSPPKESTRAFAFAGQQHFNQRSLAWALYKNWNEARKELRDIKLIRWIQLSVGRHETGEELKRLRTLTGGEYARSPAEDDDLVSRSIVVLDPAAPLRFREAACHVDGIGLMLASMHASGRMDIISHLTRMIDSDLVNFWYDHSQGHAAGFNLFATVSRIDKCRNTLRNKMVGFGLERVIYDLNPAFPCQSPLVLKEHVLTLDDLIHALDARAPEKMRESDPIDRHLLAFIGSRLDLNGDVRITIPSLQNSAQLKGFILLARAHRKIGSPPVKLLCLWVVERLHKIIEGYHSRTQRRNLLEELRHIAQTGHLENLVRHLLNADSASRDHQGFLKAMHRYRQNELRIRKLSDASALEKKASNLALKFSLFASYAAGIGSIFYAVSRFSG